MMQFNEMEIITKRHVLQVSFVLQNGIPNIREAILSRENLDNLMKFTLMAVSLYILHDCQQGRVHLAIEPIEF